MRREMMMVFQDPYASLNPRKRVGFIVGEPLEVHGIGTAAAAQAPRPGAARDRRLEPRALQPLPARVLGRPAPADRHRPRARRQPEADRLRRGRVSALDVSVQAQILNLLKDLQREFGLTYIFIAHDLNVVRHISDRVMVMYLGKAVEIATKEQLYTEPKHPYTAALLSAVPIANPELGRERSRSCSRATSRTRSTRPPRAASIPLPALRRRHVRRRRARADPARGQRPGPPTACHFPLESGR